MNNVVNFLLLLVIAAIAAGVHVWITVAPDVRGRYFAGLFVAFALLLVLPTLLPALLGGG